MVHSDDADTPLQLHPTPTHPHNYTLHPTPNTLISAHLRFQLFTSHRLVFRQLQQTW